MLKTLITTLITLLLLIACATTPLGRKQLAFMPADQMDAMGIEAFGKIKQESAVETSPSLNRYINCITDNIIAANPSQQQQWEVVVFRDDAVNAFALPGGKVGVYTGLLKVADNQNQLATVIGHEIAHVLSNHSNERVSQQTMTDFGLQFAQTMLDTQTQNGQMLMAALGLGTQFGILLPYGRKQESEADNLGLQLMANAGFEPRESVTLWQNMSQAGGEQSPEFLSTHPSHDRRIQDLNNQMNYALQLQQQARQQGKNPRCRL